jgi:hypothetical protein
VVFEHHSEDQEVGIDDQACPDEVSVISVAGGATTRLDLENDVDVWVEPVDLVGDACGAVLTNRTGRRILPEAVLPASIL